MPPCLYKHPCGQDPSNDMDRLTIQSLILSNPPKNYKRMFIKTKWQLTDANCHFCSGIEN